MIIYFTYLAFVYENVTNESYMYQTHFQPWKFQAGRAYLIVQIIISFSTFVENIENNLWGFLFSLFHVTFFPFVISIFLR